MKVSDLIEKLKERPQDEMVEILTESANPEIYYIIAKIRLKYVCGDFDIVDLNF